MELLEDDFESMLDAAFGIDSTQHEPQQAKTYAMHESPAPQQLQQQQHQQLSAACCQPSPEASPVHMYPSSVEPLSGSPLLGSPCLSDASMQMHASPPHNNSSSGPAWQQGAALHLYSPVRAGSPDEQLSPALNSREDWAAVQQQQQRQQQQQLVQPRQQHQRLQQDALAAAAAAPGDSPRLQCHQAALCLLPREVQMRVLCFLSADSLTSLGQACSLFSAMCNEPVLWRRLFVHRWGKNVRHNSAQSWKVRYMERDAAELAGAGAGQQDRGLMQDIFLQAHKAKRHKALGVGAIDDLMLVEDDDVAARVLAWRKSRGFAPQQGPDSSSQPQRPDDINLPHPSQGSGHRAPSGFTCSPGAGFGGRPRVVRRPGSGSVAAASSAGGGSCGAGTPGAKAAAAAGSQHQAAASATAASQTGLSDSSQMRCAAGQAAASAASSQQVTSTAAAAAGAAQPQTAAGSRSGSKPAKRRRRRWTQIGNVFCDELSGWVHVCDETCSEKIVEPSSGLLVCPISGTCSARLLTCAEEAEEEGDRDEEKEHREEEFGGEKGRLARAFAAGYYCSDERELLRECGVYLPH